MNSNPSQADHILLALQTAHSGGITEGWVSLPALHLTSGAYAVHSRISELRKRGYVIQNRTQKAKDGTRMSWYRLVSEEREAA